MVTYLSVNLFPDSVNAYSSVGITTNYWSCVRENPRLAMYELVQNVFLHSLVVIMYCVCFTHPQWVATVRKHYWHNLMFIVKKVTTLEISNWNLVSVPWTAKKVNSRAEPLIVDPFKSDNLNLKYHEENFPWQMCVMGTLNSRLGGVLMNQDYWGVVLVLQARCEHCTKQVLHTCSLVWHGMKHAVR